MNEKEAIEILNLVNEGNDLNTASSVKLVEIIEWLQKRVAIKEMAEIPFSQWDPDNIPYVYTLGKWLQAEAHIELDCFIMWELGDYQLDIVSHQARKAKEYLAEAFQKKV